MQATGLTKRISQVALSAVPKHCPNCNGVDKISYNDNNHSKDNSSAANELHTLLSTERPPEFLDVMISPYSDMSEEGRNIQLYLVDK